MLFAHEAARKTKEVIQNHLTEELKEIDKKIESAIESGKTETYINHPITDEAKSELKRCGYNLEYIRHYNESILRIMW